MLEFCTKQPRVSDWEVSGKVLWLQGETVEQTVKKLRDDAELES